MPDTREKLQTTLQELQTELADLDQVDEATRDELRATLAEIQSRLDAAVRGTTVSGRATTVADERDDTELDDENASLAERLNDATRGLESTHPELSTTLGSVIHALAQMGI